MDELKYHYKYPHPSVTTDCVIFGFDGLRLKVLLIQRGADPYKGRWAFPGGFMNIDESAETGALRELQEETGLEGAAVRQFHSFTQPGRDPRERVITIAFYALVRLQSVKGGDDAADARWFDLDNLPPLAFDHGMILRTAIKELRKQTYFEPFGMEVLPETFTFGELSNLYKALRGDSLDEHRLFEDMRRVGLILLPDGQRLPEGVLAVGLFRFDVEKYVQMKTTEDWLGF